MTNTAVRTAAEGMPDVNRRRLLLGLASASAVAATVSIPQADATPLENPDLIRLGNELPAFERAALDAEAAVNSIIKEWRPLWPAAPEAIVCRMRYYGDEIERDLTGWGVTRPGEEKPLRVWSAKDLAWDVSFHERQLAGKRIRSEERRASIRGKLKDLRLKIAIAKKYEAECARIQKASGIRAAQAREAETAKALTAHVDAIMELAETSMAGVMIKAQAMSAWGKCRMTSGLCGLLEARTWGPKFAASIIRLSERG
jgi:hypothetical protein